MGAPGEEPPLILLTGAAGTVGSILRQHWGAELPPRYRLRLADLPSPNVRSDVPVSKDITQGLGPHEESVQFDCADYAAFRAAAEGCHTVVHLAAYILWPLFRQFTSHHSHLP